MGCTPFPKSIDVSRSHYLYGCHSSTMALDFLRTAPVAVAEFDAHTPPPNSPLPSRPWTPQLPSAPKTQNQTIWRPCPASITLRYFCSFPRRHFTCGVCHFACLHAMNDASRSPIEPITRRQGGFSANQIPGKYPETHSPDPWAPDPTPLQPDLAPHPD